MAYEAQEMQGFTGCSATEQDPGYRGLYENGRLKGGVQACLAV